MTIDLRLQEYFWDGSAYAAGDIISFTPGPKSISKSVDVQWRVQHRGRRKLKKARFRVRETITWTLAGSCQGSYAEDALRNKIEYYAKRNSKFKVIIDSSTPQIFLTPSPDTLTLKMRSSDYVSCISSDIGKQVKDDGAPIGKLLSYVNSTRTWYVAVMNLVTVLDGSVITITAGTGSGNTTGQGSQNNLCSWEVIFVVFKNAKFTQTEGKIGWFDYTIDLERVNCENIYGYSDPWVCTCSCT